MMRMVREKTALFVSCVICISACYALGNERKAPELPADNLPAVIDIEQVPQSITLPRTNPNDNLLTAAKVALGRKLFFDPVLSKDHTVSCASCHQPNHGFASPDKKAIGINGQVGERNAPTVVNRAYGKHFFWDGRASSLEEQALKPIENKAEMGNSLQEVVRRLRSNEEYVRTFHLAYAQDGEMLSERFTTAENLAKSLAAFQRTLLTVDSPVDRFQAGDFSALTTAQKRGLWIFESRGGCWKCHSGDNYTDERFHNTGIGFGSDPPDQGRFRVTGNEKDRGKFKTPTLRGAAKTAPYMHDGSLATLRDVVEFYNQGGNKHAPNVDPRIQPLGLTSEEIDTLVDFLAALSQS